MRALVAGLAAIVLVPATATAADLTPAGPATLSEVNTFPIPPMPAMIPYVPQVSTGWSVVVGEGSSAGTVRPRFRGQSNAIVTGDPVQLPAEPGTYTFPAPHLAWGTPVGLVQTTGGHAIITRSVCHPEWERAGDPCRNLFVDVARDGQADERITGAQLALAPVYEPDTDGDLRGDATEDRTDLQVRAWPVGYANGRMRIEITVHNAGPLSADLPVLKTSGAVPARWENGSSELKLAPLAAGESRMLMLVADSPSGAGPVIAVSAEGPDLAPGDNMTTFILGAPPAFTVTAAKRQTLRKGIKVDVGGPAGGSARVTVAFKVRGRPVRVTRTVKLKPFTARTVTLRPGGATRRSLERALRRGPLTAAITVRTLDGRNPVTVKTIVR